MDAWWFKAVLGLPVKAREIIVEWSDETKYDEYLAEEYGRQIESMVSAARTWVATAPDDETKKQVVDALAAIVAMKADVESYFGRGLLDE